MSGKRQKTAMVVKLVVVAVVFGFNASELVAAPKAASGICDFDWTNQSCRIDPDLCNTCAYWREWGPQAGYALVHSASASSASHFVRPSRNLVNR